MVLQTPECNKLAAVSEISQRIGEFLDWLKDNGYHICKWQDGITDATRIADAFSIAMGKMEKGKALIEGYWDWRYKVIEPENTDFEKGDIVYIRGSSILYRKELKKYANRPL